MANNSEKFLWVCELTKNEPAKKWKAADMMEFEDEEDKDYVMNSLILKTAVLGANAIKDERNLVSIKTKGYQEKEFEQPIFSLTLGRNDMVSGLDLTIAGDQDVEFKLLEGTGPVFITCTHMIELPAQDQPTIMTNSESELEEESLDEDVEEGENGEDEDEKVDDEEDEIKEKKKAIKNGNGVKNGKAAINGKAKNGKLNGNGAEKEDIEIEVNEKPNKRKRN